MPSPDLDGIEAVVRAELERRIADSSKTIRRPAFGQTSFFWGSDPHADERTTVDWTAFPTRVESCLTRADALEILDLQSAIVGGGGRSLQEEYTEWRVVRNDDRIQSVEFTTETSDYWRVLAAYQPTRLLELVAEFASNPDVEVAALYGDLDPFAPAATPETREEAFAKTTLAGGSSPYNTGERAICCMVHPSNDLGALLALAIGSSTPCLVRDADGRTRSATCSEVGPLLGDCAQLGRASDPVIVERLGRLACEGRSITLELPPGPYIRSVQRKRLRLPDGSPIPAEWFVFSRSVAHSPDGAPRYHRVRLQIPDGDLSVTDLIDVATEQQIQHGAQIADLIQVAIDFRVTPPGAVVVDRQTPTELPPPEEDPSDCQGVRAQASRLHRDEVTH